MQLGSAADLRRRFRTGRPCLDLVHTGGDGALAPWEIVNNSVDLGQVLGRILGLPTLPVAGADLDTMRTLRGALTRLAYRTALGHLTTVTGADKQKSSVPAEVLRTARAAAGTPASSPADIAVVNEVAARPALVRALRLEGGTVHVAPSAAAALASIAQDAVDLFGGPLVDRIRICSAEDCGLLFVDASRPGRRRWCSMERCGNRSKVRAHRSRLPATTD